MGSGGPFSIGAWFDGKSRSPLSKRSGVAEAGDQPEDGTEGVMGRAHWAEWFPERR